MRGGKDEDTFNENLPSMGDGEWGYIDTVTQLHCHARIHKKMAYNREEVQWAWLLVVFSLTIFW